MKFSPFDFGVSSDLVHTLKSMLTKAKEIEEDELEKAWVIKEVSELIEKISMTVHLTLRPPWICSLAFDLMYAQHQALFPKIGVMIYSLAKKIKPNGSDYFILSAINLFLKARRDTLLLNGIQIPDL